MVNTYLKYDILKNKLSSCLSLKTFGLIIFDISFSLIFYSKSCWVFLQRMSRTTVSNLIQAICFISCLDYSTSFRNNHSASFLAPYIVFSKAGVILLKLQIMTIFCSKFSKWVLSHWAQSHARLRGWWGPVWAVWTVSWVTSLTSLSLIHTALAHWPLASNSRPRRPLLQA